MRPNGSPAVRKSGGGRTAPSADLELCRGGGLARACILLLLAENPEHGYGLSQRLETIGFPRSDRGIVYRTLRNLDRAGLVRPDWRTEKAGPARRVYELTTAGTAALEQSATKVQELSTVLERYLCRYRTGTEGTTALNRLEGGGVDSEAGITGWTGLTPAERQVAKLVAEGLTNREIAGRLFVSKETVKGHLASVFAKLSISSRRELRRSPVGPE